MKTIPIITFFLCTVMYAHAQLNIVPKNDGLKEYTVTNAHPYDSLTNVEKRSFTSLPGQTLYMHGVKNDRNGYWDAFYTVNFLTGDDRTVYKAVNISTTPSKEVVGKYYEVVKVWTKTDYLSAGCCLLLREKESGDEMYYNPFRYPLSMTCIGYYEKLKRFVGQTFLSLAKAVETEDGQVITPAEGAEYRCVDIGLNRPRKKNRRKIRRMTPDHRLKMRATSRKVQKMLKTHRLNQSHRPEQRRRMRKKAALIRRLISSNISGK